MAAKGGKGSGAPVSQSRSVTWTRQVPARLRDHLSLSSALDPVPRARAVTVRDAARPAARTRLDSDFMHSSISGSGARHSARRCYEGRVGEEGEVRHGAGLKPPCSFREEASG